MHRLIFMAGTIIASSLGFALAGLVLCEAIRNARAHKIEPSRPVLTQVDSEYIGWESVIRGYDSPEIAREDRLARARHSGNNRSVG
jgi:hypothetical protein